MSRDKDAGVFIPADNLAAGVGGKLMIDAMIRNLTNIETGEQVIMLLHEDIEYINPTIYFKENFLKGKLIENGLPFEEVIGRKISEKGAKVFFESEKFWDCEIEKMNRINLSKDIIPLIKTTKKKQQERLLKEKIITPEILLSLIYDAYLTFGFTFSQYVSEILPKDIDEKKLPVFFEVRENKVLKYGKTEYTDKQLKAIIKQRKKIVAIFLDKEDKWHCFFTTFKSLRTEETWLNQKMPHFHYTSNAFGVSRADVIKQLKSEQYKLNTLPHIELINYR